MNRLSDYRGPKPVTPQNLFRSTAAGATIGPYLSQFWFSDVKVTMLLLVQIRDANILALFSLEPMRLTCG